MSSQTEPPKDLHANSNYPVHTPNKGTIKPSRTMGDIITGWWKKLFG